MDADIRRRLNATRPPPQTRPFTGRTLTDILQAQVEMDKEVNLRSDGMGDRYWCPHAFIVVVHVEWEEKGLLFVSEYDDEETGRGLFAVDRYFFKPKGARMMLSSLGFGDEYLVERSEELYEIVEDGFTGLERRVLWMTINRPLSWSIKTCQFDSLNAYIVLLLRD